MTLGPLLLLFSALLHAAWNALAKGTKDKESFLFLTILLSGLITGVFALGTEGAIRFPSGTAFQVAVVSGIFEGLYFLTLSKALRDSSLGKSYAIMRGGAMVLVWLYSTLLLGERAQGTQYLGALTILGGILIINAQDLLKNGGKSLRKDLWSYISALFIAGYHLSYHHALMDEADPRPLFFVAMIVSLPFLLWGIRHNITSRLQQTLQQHGLRVLATGSFATASFLIFLYGLRISAPGFAISLRNSSIFFAVIFSLMMKESLTRTQIVGACAIGLGALLLSL